MNFNLRYLIKFICLKDFMKFDKKSFIWFEISKIKILMLKVSRWIIRNFVRGRDKVILMDLLGSSGL